MLCLALTLLKWLATAAVGLVLLVALPRIWYDGVVTFFVDTLRRVPLTRRLIEAGLRRQVKRLMEEDFNIVPDGKRATIPEKGCDPQELQSKLKSLRTQQTDRMFAYVYAESAEVLGRSLERLQHETACEFLDAGDEEESPLDSARRQLVRQYLTAFMHENALNPSLFKALRQFEVELVQMTAAMLHAGEGARGNVTSGGTESILMAVKTYRELARQRKPGVTRPNIVAATTAHPAFNKAANYFGLEMVQVPVDLKTQKPPIEAVRRAIDSNTILLVASAPQYCHGIVDPVEELAALAEEFGLPMHVDACFGGFMLPWVERLGYPVPKFDFRVNGVTSMSADLHKYGFAPKGASVVVYRNASLRKHQLFAYSGWPGGLFGSPTMAGTRPGGYLATAWVTLRLLGCDGYLDVAKQLMELTKYWIGEINDTEYLRVVGSPHMTCFAIASANEKVNIFVVADLMDEKGWKMEREMNPDCLHVTVMPHHLARRQEFAADLRECANRILKENLQPKGLASVYGMVARVPAKELINDFLLEFFNQIYS